MRWTSTTCCAARPGCSRTSRKCCARYQERYEYLLVDEFQDTNSAQYEMVCAGRQDRNMFCVGDEDQSIYGFRGADYRNVLRFREDFPEAKVDLA